MSLTIVMPTIGRESMLHAVWSIANQTVDTDCILQYDPERQGASLTRNQAVQRVKTTWVGFCDDDDWLDLRYHQWLNEECEGFDMVIFNMRRPEGIVLPDHTDVDKLAYNWVGISFALKTAIAKKFPFNNMVGEDYDLIMRVKEAGYKIKISERVAYFIG